MYWCALKFMGVRSEAEFRKLRPVTFFALLDIEMNYKQAALGIDGNTENVSNDMQKVDDILMS